MRVGIDARAYGWEGLGRYARNLLRRLTTLATEDELVVFAPRRFAREISALSRTRVVPVTSSYYSLREQTVFLGSLLEERLDLMHFLHFNAPVFYRRPSVVTIHDLTRFFFPAQKHTGPFHQWAYEEVFRATVLHAHRVIAVSQHTRTDLLRFFPDVAGRVVVIPEGVDHDRFHPRSQPSDTPTLATLDVRQPYLLFVGVWMNHKNLSRLLEAFRHARARGFTGTLVITGEGRSHDVDVRGIVRRLGLADHVVLPGKVPEDVLPALYRRAEAFVFPSLYEGFGFPPLEAMACGTPVIASHVASLPEVLGNAAEYVDPLSVDDIARGILHVLGNREHRSALVAAGLRRAQMYHWDTCARETLQLYATLPQRERVVQNTTR